MALDIVSTSEAFGAAVTAIGAVYGAIRHVGHKIRDKREKHKEEILGLAKEEMGRIRDSLENKIRDLEIELENQKDNVAKDFSHIKEVYNAEIRALGDKIDSLRSDLSAQHTNMVNLLTKLVNSN